MWPTECRCGAYTITPCGNAGRMARLLRSRMRCGEDNAMSVVPLRWGILGTGTIAHTFAQALSRTDAARLVAVGSRSGESAARFAAGYGCIRAHPSYAGLIGDSEVDAVYVATPHPMHAELAITAARTGKHVLCDGAIGRLGIEKAPFDFVLSISRPLFVFECARRRRDSRCWRPTAVYSCTKQRRPCRTSAGGGRSAIWWLWMCGERLPGLSTEENVDDRNRPRDMCEPRFRRPLFPVCSLCHG